MEKQTAADKQFHLRLSRDLFDRLARLAKQSRRSITAEMIMAIEAWCRARDISEIK